MICNKERAVNRIMNEKRDKFSELHNYNQMLKARRPALRATTTFSAYFSHLTRCRLQQKMKI